VAIDIPATGSAYKVWDGGANTVNWSDASNWSGNTLPGATDDVYVPAGITVNYNTTATVRSIGGDGTLNLNGGTLTPAQDSAVKTLNLSGGTLTVNTPAVFTVQSYNQSSGTLNGSGNLAVNGLLTYTGGSMTGSGETIANGGAWFGPGSDKWIRGGRLFTNNGKATVAATVYMYNDGTPPLFNNPARSGSRQGPAPPGSAAPTTTAAASRCFPGSWISGVSAARTAEPCPLRRGPSLPSVPGRTRSPQPPP